MSKTGVHFRGRHPEFQVFPFLGPLVFLNLGVFLDLRILDVVLSSCSGMARVTQSLNTVLELKSADWMHMHAWLHAYRHCTPQMLHKQPWSTEPNKNTGSGAKRRVGTWIQAWALQLRNSAASHPIARTKKEIHSGVIGWNFVLIRFMPP